MRDLHELTDERDMRLSIGIPRGDHMGPPIGNLHIDWGTWLGEGLLDSLVIGRSRRSGR